MTKLQKELKATGADNEEIRALLPIASGLKRLRPKRNRWIQPVSFSVSGLLVGALVVIFAQGVLPSNALFPIQKATDALAVIVAPSYHATVMMKRADQVNQLVASNADTQTILATINDYTTQAQAYKTVKQDYNDNYTAFVYCETKLAQAEKSASPEVNSAIAHSLQAVEAS